jgi:uncharacterized protein
VKSCIYTGRVSHHRFQPHLHGFNYRLFMMYLDLDELPDLFSPFLLWSAKRPALAWFRRQDHMAKQDKPLAQCIRELIHKQTGKQHFGPVRLLTHLRYFGYCMNPVSFYYCWDEDEKALDYIVAEVHNTPWGETHCYVLDCQVAGQQDCKFHFRFDKKFHVSPFMDLRQRYEWSLSAPGNQLRVNMASYERDSRMFNADMKLERRAISQTSMAGVLVTYPLMTLKVTAAIYWQAMKLWLRRTPLYSHPKHLEHELNQ